MSTEHEPELQSAAATAEIELRNDLAELARLHAFLQSLEHSHGLNPSEVGDLRIIFEELAVNAIHYGCEAGRAHVLLARVEVTPTMWSFEFRDDGKPFDPLTLSAPDLSCPMEICPIGGLGIHFIRELTDRLEYHYQEGRNVLAGAKRRLPPAENAGAEG